MTDSFMTVHRKAIVELAMRHKVPFMYYISVVPREGGLISYGIDLTNEFRRSASYVDRILRGANPATLPVQLPTKFELVINLKTAKALGLTVPKPLLTGADEVIE
jgi:putative ABC transport system substrate-binding protein